MGASVRPPSMLEFEQEDASRVERTEFRTRSGILIDKPVYGPQDIKDWNSAEKLGDPGEYPFARGIHPEMYRRRRWTRRHNAGYGLGEDTNALFKFLLSTGLTGLNIALDLPTQMGYDADDPEVAGEVGRVGVNLTTLDDMIRVYDSIPLDGVSTSTAMNGLAIVFLAQYVLAGKNQGVSPDRLRGTIQNDVLKEYLSRGCYLFPVGPSVRLVCDVVEWCMKNAPKINSISVSSGHMMEAGATHIQAYAFSFANALTYLDEMERRGYPADLVSRHFSFLTTTTVQFFEAAANARAARRLWAGLLRKRYGVTDKRALSLRLAVGGDCTELTVEQPLNNLARITLQTAGAALGGAQAVLIPAYDEAYGIPTEESFRATLMAQTIVAEESGAGDVVDPLGGSYFVEWLTDRSEEEMQRWLDFVDAAGGMVRGIESGAIQREIAAGAYKEERALQSAELVRIGVNKFILPDEDIAESESKAFRFDPEISQSQIARVREVKANRDVVQVRQALAELKEAAEDEHTNLVEPVIKAVAAYATTGEIASTLKEVFGGYRPATGL